MKSSFHRFMNVWVTVSVIIVLAGIAYSFYYAGLHQYAEKALGNMRKSVFGNVFNDLQVVGGAFAFSLAFIYLLVRRLAGHPTRIRRTLAILCLLGIGLVAAFALFMNFRLESGQNRIYGQYVNMQKFAVRAILSGFLNLPQNMKTALTFLFASLLAALTFVASFFEHRIFRKALPKSPNRPPKQWIWVTAFIVGLAAVVFVRANKPAKASADYPDVILISIDTLRADHLGSYGYERNTSPNLDTLAATQGILVEKFISHAPWTLPAHMTMFTGRIPSSHGVTQPLDSVSPSVTLFTEILKDRGYRTGGYATNILLGSSYGFSAGFDSYVVSSKWDAEQVIRNATKWLLDKKQPAFLFLHLFDPHYPYTPKSPFKGMFRAPNLEVDAIQEKGFYDFFQWMITRGDEERLATIALYDEEIAYTDWALGELFRRLRAENRWDNTWIIVTSDHGEEFGERGLWGHGITLYNEQLHVPLIIKMPKDACAGARLKDVLVPQKALFQLITSAAMPLPPDSPDLQCGPAGVPPIIGKLATTDVVVSEVDMLGPLRYSGMTPGKKLLDPAKVSAGGVINFERGFELYDLAADPKEKYSLFAGMDKSQIPGRIRLMAPELQRAMCDTRIKYASKLKTGTVQLDAATIEKLRSLGYISTGGGLSEKAQLDENCMPAE